MHLIRAKNGLQVSEHSGLTIEARFKSFDENSK